MCMTISSTYTPLISLHMKRLYYCMLEYLILFRCPFSRNWSCKARFRTSLLFLKTLSNITKMFSSCDKERLFYSTVNIKLKLIDELNSFRCSWVIQCSTDTIHVFLSLTYLTGYDAMIILICKLKTFKVVWIAVVVIDLLVRTMFFSWRRTTKSPSMTNKNILGAIIDINIDICLIDSGRKLCIIY